MSISAFCPVCDHGDRVYCPSKEGQQKARKIPKELHKIGLIEIQLPSGELRYSLATIDKDQLLLLNSYGLKKMGLPSVV